MSQEAVNSAQIAMLIESDRELKEIIKSNSEQADRRQKETNEVLNKLLEAQVRSEERQLADREWQKRVDKHQDAQDVNIEEAKEIARNAEKIASNAEKQATSNGRWIYRAWAGGAFLVGIILTALVNKFIGA